MRYAKWILIVVLLTVLTSFMGKDKPTKGLNVGNIAPDFNIASVAVSRQASELSDFQGKYVLLSFWASYDATSRMMNTTLNHTLRTSAQSSDVEMVSVSFDSYRFCFPRNNTPGTGLDRLSVLWTQKGKHRIFIKNITCNGGLRTICWMPMG